MSPIRMLLCGTAVAAVFFTAGCSWFDTSDNEEASGKIPPAVSDDPKDLNAEAGKDGWGAGANANSLASREGDWTPIPGVHLDPVYFDFDKDAIKDSEKSKLNAAAEYMKKHPDQGLIIEGNCDDRGSLEYNRGLGERRAIAARNYLAQLGVSDAKMKTISYGKEKPAVQGTSPEARAKNRRDELVPAKMN